jgi:hypothetical protein
VSLFLPEGSGQQPQPGVASVTPANPETTGEDIALMQRVLSAASRNVNMIPTDFMAYLIDYVQTSNLQIPIGQVFGYQRIAPQVITDFAQVPLPTDGQIVLLKIGSGAPYTYVQMMYDQSINQWVSEEFSLAAGTGSTGNTTPTLIAVSGAMSWKAVHLGGLTMQAKWAGTASTTNASSAAHGGIFLEWSNFTGGGAATNATMSDALTTSVATVTVGVDWANITDPGAYELMIAGVYAYNALGGNTANITAGVVGRFIK